MNTRRKHIGIVGGGILGMTLALRLTERGLSVTILEGATRTGGLASPCRIGPYTWDQFYHVILMSDSNVLWLLERLRLTEKTHWGHTKTGFYTDGKLHSMSNIMEFFSFPPLSLFSKLRLGLTIFYASRIRSWERLECLSVEDWLVKFSGKRTFERIWLPLLKSKLGENYRRANAVFIWAIIDRMYAARRSGLKREMFGYVEGGYAEILDRFQLELDEIGVTTLCQTKVINVTNNEHGVRVITESRDTLEFDELILTIPCNQMPALCPGLSVEEKERFQNVTYQGVISAALLLKNRLAGYYITNITDGVAPFTGVIELTALVGTQNFGGNSLVYLPRYASDGDSYWKRADDEIQAEFLAALEVMYPNFNKKDLLFAKIVRAREVLPLTTLNYSKHLLPPSRTSLKHVFVVNSAQIANGTMNVNEIIGLANKKAEEITGLLCNGKREPEFSSLMLSEVVRQL